MSEAELSAEFQAFAEMDETPSLGKCLLVKANERNMPLLKYSTETGPEIREIFDRMMIAEARHRLQSV